MDADLKPTISSVLMGPNDSRPVNGTCDKYLEYFDSKQSDKDNTLNRKNNAVDVADSYYDLATDFFEYGWGESFHFAPLRKGESREHAFAKHEYWLAHKLELKEGERVLDTGCGVGGPARHIAAFTGAKITGITINDYQIKRATQATAQAKLQHLVNFENADFNNTPYESGSFDKIYAIEATCHASDKKGPYGEAYRLLKPGGLYAIYEWAMTDKYNPKNAYHKKVKEDIMEGDGLPDIESKQVCLDAIKASGFEVLEAQDLATIPGTIPWHSVLMPQWTIQDFKITPMGRWATHLMLFGMESIGLAPKGSVKVHRMLCKGADGLVKGGKEEIFTPMFFVLARKPLH